MGLRPLRRRPGRRAITRGPRVPSDRSVCGRSPPKSEQVDSIARARPVDPRVDDRRSKSRSTSAATCPTIVGHSCAYRLSRGDVVSRRGPRARRIRINRRSQRGGKGSDPHHGFPIDVPRRSAAATTTAGLPNDRPEPRPCRVRANDRECRYADPRRSARTASRPFDHRLPASPSPALRRPFAAR